MPVVTQEGMDSAAGGMKDARNNEFQAILPIRGKILNVLKAPLEKALANAEINTMIQAFGLSFDSKTKKIIFNENNLRYGKIIISTDADQDGGHIQSLFYTFIWTFAPQLIEKGYVFASVPPLYRVTIGKEYKYLKDDTALDNFKRLNSGKKFSIGRMKGLGEMDPHELEETMLDPGQREIKQIMIGNMGSAEKLFSDLMGDSAIPRKAYIEKYSGEIEVTG